MTTQQRKFKRWGTPKKIQSFIRFHTLPGAYFVGKKQRLKNSKKRRRNFSY